MHAWGNSISGNNITNNNNSVWLGSTSGNKFYHNNFINNTQQVYDFSWDSPQICPPSINVWDDGYPSGGNYWSGYIGVDAKSGPNQDQPSSDGIGDTAYVIYANNTDHYPLIYPWGTPLYTLIIYSSPTGAKFTVDGVSRTTPWSGTYSEGASVSLVMPETHNVLVNYVWSCWREDGDPNRIKTVTMDTNITLTAVYKRPTPVGGKATPINIPTNKPETPTPWIWLTTIILSLIVTVGYVKKRKRKSEINS